MDMRAHLIEIEIKIDHWQSTQRSIISNYVICQIRWLLSIVIELWAIANCRTPQDHGNTHTYAANTHLLPAANTDTRQLISHCVAASARCLRVDKPDKTTGIMPYVCCIIQLSCALSGLGSAAKRQVYKPHTHTGTTIQPIADDGPLTHLHQSLLSLNYFA